MQEVAELCHVQVSDLGIAGHFEIPAQQRIVEDFILKNQILSGEDFLFFMAERGQECISRDRETGELLMELALQRVSKAVPHDAYDMKKALPVQYQQFSAADDEPSVLSQACWDFICNNLVYCYEKLTVETWRYHAKLILLGLLEHIDENGSLYEFSWDSSRINLSPAMVYKWAMHQAMIKVSIYEIACHLGPRWRCHLDFFRFIEDVVDWNSKKIREAFRNDPATDKNGMPYFSKGMRRILKLTGLYDYVLIKKIREDIRSR